MLSTRTGIRPVGGGEVSCGRGKRLGGQKDIPLGSRRRNQSFFCSLVMMLIRVVVHSVL